MCLSAVIVAMRSSCVREEEKVAGNPYNARSEIRGARAVLGNPKPRQRTADTKPTYSHKPNLPIS